MSVRSKKRGSWVVNELRAVGTSFTINSQSVKVTARDASGNVSECNGTVTITDGGAGYAKGCRYTKTDGAVASTLFINEGSSSSCDFNAMETSASTVTGVTAGKGLTGGGSEGSVTLNLGVTVYNNLGSTLTPGTLVRLSGYTSTNGITVAKADADALAYATHVVVDAITNNTAGVVYPVAVVTGLATNGTSIGDAVYLDATTAGGFTFSAPSGADQFVQVVGYVKVVHASTGEIAFNPGFSLKKAGTSLLQDSAITTAKIAANAVTPTKLGTETASNVTRGSVLAATIMGAPLKALMTGAATAAVSIPAGGVVIDVLVSVNTPSGGAGNFDVGVDAGADSGVDEDGLLVNVDHNTSAVVRSSMLDVASQALVSTGASFSAGGNVTVTSSGDITASALDASLTVFYYIV